MMVLEMCDIREQDKGTTKRTRVQLFRAPWRDKLIRLLKEAEEEVFLCSPYLDWEIIQAIIKEMPKVKRLTILTSGDPRNKDALLHLYGNDSIETKLIDNLHAKVYLLDEKIAIITSSNLAKAGLGVVPGKENYEIGVIIIKDTTLIGNLKKYLEELLECATSLQELSRKDLEELPVVNYTDAPRRSRRLSKKIGRWRPINLDELSKKLRLTRYILLNYLLQIVELHKSGSTNYQIEQKLNGQIKELDKLVPFNIKGRLEHPNQQRLQGCFDHLAIRKKDCFYLAQMVVTH